MPVRREHPQPRHRRTTPTLSHPDRACSSQASACIIDKLIGRIGHPAKTSSAVIAWRSFAALDGPGLMH